MVRTRHNSNNRCHICPAEPQAAGTDSSMKLPSADLSGPNYREYDIRASSTGTKDFARLVVNAVSEIIAICDYSWKESLGKEAGKAASVECPAAWRYAAYIMDSHHYYKRLVRLNHLTRFCLPPLSPLEIVKLT
jgi:hypothetical protein